MPFLSPLYLISVFLVFVRIGALFAVAPFFGHRSVPVRLRVFLALIMAYAMVGLVPGPPPETVLHPLGLMVAVGIEALTGVTIGYAAHFVFWGILYASEIFGFQIGLGLAHVYNPIDGSHSNPLGQFILMVFLLLFLLLDGHHQILRALTYSFHVVPLAGAEIQAGGPLMLEWAGDFFVTALRLAAPFMVTTFLLDLTLGVFARVVPQADLFSLGLPLKLMAGLVLFLLFMQHFFPIAPTLVEQMMDDLLRLVNDLIPG